MEKVKVQKTKNCKILTIPNNGTSGIVILALIRTGSRNETNKISGIAHFLEHMLFDGTKKRPSSTLLSNAIDSLGGSLNGFTSKEYTGYYARILPENLSTGLDIISDMIFNSKISDADILKEKSVISEEIKMVQDIPPEDILDIIEEVLWPNTNLGRTITGTIKSVNTISKSDIMKFLGFYNYQNSCVVVSGNPKYLQSIKKQIEKYFRFNKTNMPEDKLIPIIQKKPNIKIINKKTEQTHIAIAFPTIGTNNEDKYPLSLLSNIIGGTMSSRLFDKIRSQLALAYYIKSHSEQYQDAGFFQINAGIAHNNSQKVINEILKELEKIKKSGPTEIEINNAKQNIKGNLKLSLDDPLNCAHFYGFQAMFEKEILTPKQIIEKFNKLSRKDVQKTAQKYFDFNKLNIALIGKGKIKI